MSSEFAESIYRSISLNELVILAMNEISDNGEECAYERVVKECFTLFPKRFCFQRYPEWPDGNRVKTRMLDCRNKGWVVGNEKTGFQITLLGKRVAEEVLKALGKATPRKTRPTHSRDRGDTIISHLKQSEAFIRYRNNKSKFEILDGEFRYLLIATEETPSRILRQNIDYYIGICIDYRENELLDFLNECKRQKATLLKKGR